jgi:haloalkane dehalogenase
MYRALVKTLAPDYRCLVPDHLGLGLSSRPRSGEYGFRLADRINDLTAFMASLKLTEPVHVVVHDWGGPIGLGWAGANPDLVASLIIFNTGLRLPSPDYAPPLVLGLFRNTGFLGQLLANRFNLFLRGFTQVGSVRPMPPAVVEGFLAPYSLAFLRPAIGRFVKDIPLAPNHPSFSALNRVDQDFDRLAKTPTLLVWGLADFVFSPVFLADFKARRPKASVLALPRAGHLLLEDEPVKIGATARQFLSQARRPGESEVL